MPIKEPNIVVQDGPQMWRDGQKRERDQRADHIARFDEIVANETAAREEMEQARQAAIKTAEANADAHVVFAKAESKFRSAQEIATRARNYKAGESK